MKDLFRGLGRVLVHALVVGATFSVIFIFSCKSAQIAPQKESLSGNLLDAGTLTAAELANYFLSQNPKEDRSEIERLALYYIDECSAEGINSDAAFAQMCLETGFLKFGNLVTRDMNNFAGLGAIDERRPGERFPTVELGVRAHIQHLHAYATKEGVALKNDLVDNRYKYVQPRGKATTVYQLAGTWAADEHYGEKLFAILSQMVAYKGAR